MRHEKSDKSGPTQAFLLAQVGARAAGEFARLLEPLKLLPPDAGILRLLNLSPGMSQQELARRLSMYPSRLVAIIDALEERGLVARTANAEDRRIYSLQLTDAGREALQAIGRAAREQNELICAALNAKEREQLGLLLKKIAAQQGLAPGIHPGYRRMGDGCAGDAKK